MVVTITAALFAELAEKNTFDKGYCTWGVAEAKKIDGKYLDWKGDASDWCSSASQKGYVVKQKGASVGNIIVFGKAKWNGNYGHVGIVEETTIDGNATKMRSMNDGVFGEWKSRGLVKGYFYDKSTPLCYIEFPKIATEEKKKDTKQNVKQNQVTNTSSTTNQSASTGSTSTGSTAQPLSPQTLQIKTATINTGATTKQQTPEKKVDKSTDTNKSTSQKFTIDKFSVKFEKNGSMCKQAKNIPNCYDVNFGFLAKEDLTGQKCGFVTGITGVDDVIKEKTPNGKVCAAKAMISTTSDKITVKAKVGQLQIAEGSFSVK